MTDRQSEFPHLDPAARAVAETVLRPMAIVWVAIAGAVGLSWLVLAAMAVGVAQVSPDLGFGPGGGLLGRLPDLPLTDTLRVFVALCLQPATGPAGIGVEFAVLTSMWMLMAVATMLPTAAPMVRTYCEIADTAADKGERVVHPLVLVAGYLAVWLVASLGFAALALALRTGGAAAGAVGPVTGIAGGVALLIAGAYQFSSLKQACLEKCRNPFSILFSRWSTRPMAILRLGAEQGLWCLGCCWALMLVMFAVGLMNLFWMALIGLFALVEKSHDGPVFTRVSGAILLVWGAALLVVSL
jgi:predicted metal-binding membrane protein